MYAMFYFDMKYLISALGEMLIDSMGIKRRFTLDTMTVQGDESMHTLEKGKKYRSFVNNIKWPPPSLNIINETSYGAMMVINFMQWASAHNVAVVGGLPTTFNDYSIPNESINNITNFYKRNGHYFIVMKNRSQYPRNSFYDTEYHLAEEFQISHSKMLAKYFKKILSNQ